MKLTLTAIRADISDVSGRSSAIHELLNSVAKQIEINDPEVLLDHYISHTGNNIALVVSHRQGRGSERVHKLCRDVLAAGIEAGRKHKLNGAKGPLGNVLNDAGSEPRPAVAEMEFEERPNESFLLFSADRSSVGCYNLPLYMAFADPLNTPGLMLSAEMNAGFRFTIMDSNHTQGDRIIELSAPDELYTIAALLRDPERFVVDSIRARASGELVASVSTSRLRTTGDGQGGIDNPLMLIRVQNRFPATGEILAPYANNSREPFSTSSAMLAPMMPVTLNSGSSHIGAAPMISCAAMAVNDGRFTEAVDTFAHPFWDKVRVGVSSRINDRRRRVPDAAKIPASSHNYNSMENLKSLEQRFLVRSRGTTDYTGSGYRSLDVF